MVKQGIVKKRTGNGERFINFKMQMIWLSVEPYFHIECHRFTYTTLNLIEQDNKCNGRIEKMKEKKKINHFAIYRRFRSCLMEVKSRASADLFDNRQDSTEMQLSQITPQSSQGSAQLFPL